MFNRCAQAILEVLEQCPVIDTHEHLENECRQPHFSVLSDYTRHYFSSDLISAGMDPRIIDRLACDELSIGEKWALVAPYWEYCRQTGYGRMLDLSAGRLYGVDEINADTIETVEKGFQELRGNPGYGERILRDICHIERVVNNIWHLNGDDLNGFFWFVTQIDKWVSFDGETELMDRLSSISGIDEWVELAIQTLSDDFDLRGAKGIKLAVAYRRTLLFENVTKENAQKSFDEMRMTGSDGKAAQDYVLHAIMRWADEKNIIVQIHTGYQEGNDNIIKNSNPEPLNELIRQYPNIRFDLFHIGFPYQTLTCALGKMYPNVRINMCWAHILTPMLARNMLMEWITAVPSNKIFAFGGDVLFYDGVIGHLEITKENVARALGTLAEEGYMSLERAEQIARWLFYDNPKNFYDGIHI